MPTIIRTQIIGTDHVIYSAWEAYDGHSCYRTQPDKLGKITCRRVPASLDALTGDVRYAVVTDWLRGLEREATDAIVAAHPWLTEVGQARNGEVHVNASQEVFPGKS